MSTTALGLIEVKGYVGAIEAADAALKAANVSLEKIERIKGGLVTVMLTGDVGAVKAAVDAGTVAAGKCSTIISSHVIARVHEETKQTLIQPYMENVFQEEDEVDSFTIEDHAKAIKEEENHSVENVPEMNDQEKGAEMMNPPESDDEQQGKNIENSEQSLEQPTNLEELTVEELRKLVRSFRLKHVTPNEIKFGRKEFLLEVVTNHFREEDDE